MLGFYFLKAGSLLVMAASPVSPCEMPKPTDITVSPKTLEIKYDTERSLADLQSQSVDTINPYSFHGVSMTQGFMKGRIKMEPQVKLDYKHLPEYGAVCLWYESVNVEIEIDPAITLAKEVYQDPCMRQAVTDHEMKHVMADRKIVNKYAKIMGKKVFDGLKQRGFKVGPVKQEEANHIAERMQKTVFQIVEHEYKKMDLERTEAQQAIDTLEEYRSVDARCPDFQQNRGVAPTRRSRRN